MGDLTNDALLQIAMHGMSVLSLLACIAVFVSMFRTSRLHTVLNSMIVNAIICDFALSIAFAFGSYPFKSYETNVVPCYIQGITIQFMFLANSAWNLLMPFHCYLLLQGDGSSDQGSNMPFYHAYAWSLATFFTALLFIVQKVKGGLAIGNATLECWISDEFKEYRIWLFYLWLWLQFACMIALYVVVWHKVKAMTGRQRNAASDAIAVGRQRMLRKAMALAVGFSITWIPASASRIVGALGYEVPYWLFVLQSLTMPAHGLSDSMIFLAFAYSKQSSDGAARHDVAGDAVRMASLSERSKGAVQIELMRRNK